jgi:hypothetical protein
MQCQLSTGKVKNISALGSIWILDTCTKEQKSSVSVNNVAPPIIKAFLQCNVCNTEQASEKESTI